MTATTTVPPAAAPAQVAEELAGRLFEAGLGSFELATVALGARLGLYRALADRGPATAGELADEMVHDLADPIAALRTARRLTGDGVDPVIVVDERATERFAAPADPLQRFFYAASVLHCLPVGRCAEHSVATGTVLRPDTLRDYATRAGFAHFTVLPIEADLFRFYRMEG